MESRYLSPEEEMAKDERRHFQRACNALNIIVCLLMACCQGFMITYQIPFYSSLMFTIQYFRRGVIMIWLLVLALCNFGTKGFFKKNFPLFARRRFRHIAYGFAFAAIGLFTMQDPLTLALYQGYQQHLCEDGDTCAKPFSPEIMLYIIVGCCTICIASLPLGFINAVIVWMFYNKYRGPEDKDEGLEETEKDDNSNDTKPDWRANNSIRLAQTRANNIEKLKEQRKAQQKRQEDRENAEREKMSKIRAKVDLARPIEKLAHTERGKARIAAIRAKMKEQEQADRLSKAEADRLAVLIALKEANKEAARRVTEVKDKRILATKKAITKDKVVPKSKNDAEVTAIANRIAADKAAWDRKLAARNAEAEKRTNANKKAEAERIANIERNARARRMAEAARRDKEKRKAKPTKKTKAELAIEAKEKAIKEAQDKKERKVRAIDIAAQANSKLALQVAARLKARTEDDAYDEEIRLGDIAEAAIKAKDDERAKNIAELARLTSLIRANEARIAKEIDKDRVKLDDYIDSSRSELYDLRISLHKSKKWRLKHPEVR